MIQLFLNRIERFLKPIPFKGSSLTALLVNLNNACHKGLVLRNAFELKLLTHTFFPIQ